MSTTELLDIPEVREHISPVSVEEYHKTGERNARGRRTELVRGLVIEKMPKSPQHSWLTRKLYKLIAQALGEREGMDLTLWQDEPLTFIDSEPEPDISLSVGGPDLYRDAHPTTAQFVIEIAVTSLRLDRVKAQLYAEAGIPEYWIIETVKKQVEVYTQPEDGGYAVKEIYELPATIQCQAIPEIKIPVSVLFP